MALGQAAGFAAAQCSKDGKYFADVDGAVLRKDLASLGAIPKDLLD